MIKTLRGYDILGDVRYGVIIHGCNAQGVMGSGFAKEVKTRFPAVYEAYILAAQDGLKLGQIIPVQVGPHKYIVNAITQEFYGNDGRRYVDYDAVKKCFEETDAFMYSLPISPRELHFPKVGCGLGGGDWEIISKIIDNAVTHGKYLHVQG